MLHEVDTITCAKMKAQLADASANRLDITQVAGCQTFQTQSDSRLHCLVTDPDQPVSERNGSVLFLISEQSHLSTFVA